MSELEQLRAENKRLKRVIGLARLGIDVDENSLKPLSPLPDDEVEALRRRYPGYVVKRTAAGIEWTLREAGVR